MKFILIFLFTTLVSCKNKSNEEKETSKQSDSKIEKCLNIDFKLNNLEIENPKSIIDNYVNLKGKLIKGESLPHITLLNKTKTQKVKMVTFPGSSTNDVYQFFVSKAKKTDESLPTIKYESFVSNSGIHFGLSKEEVIKIKGDNFLTKENAIYYEFSHLDCPEISEKFNFPIYFSEYFFDDDNKLDKFSFGLVYP